MPGVERRRAYLSKGGVWVYEIAVAIRSTTVRRN